MVGLIICLVVIAFLLGRESIREPFRPSETLKPAVAPAPSPVAAISVAPQPAVPSPTYTEARVAVRRDQPPHLSLRSAPRSQYNAPPVSPGVDAATRQQVTAYFRQMDNIQPGQMSGDPQAMANEVLDSAMKGNTTQLDDIVRKSQSAEQRARSVNPPAHCAHYHQQAVALMGESVQIVRTMRRAIHDNDSNALLSLSARASTLQSHVESLRVEEQDLKRRYGVP